jgi:uncharacterized cupin superfamily protein
MMSGTATASFRPVIAIEFPPPPVQESRPPAERIVSGDPLQRTWNYYSSPDGHFHAGLWDCAVGKWRVVFTESEFCLLLVGLIVVTGDDGSQRTFRGGDAFISPAGFSGWWDVREPARKYYTIHE